MARQPEWKDRPRWIITNDYLDSHKATSRFSGKERFLDALIHQLWLQATLHDVNRKIERLEIHANTDLLCTLLGDLQKPIDNLNQLITDGLMHDALFNAPTHHSAAGALEVFKIAEVAEMILLDLEPKDLFAVE